MRFTAVFRVISASLAFLLVASLAVLMGPAMSARADLGDPAALALRKTVNTQPAITGVAPGETFTYDIVVGCDDNYCIDATLVDSLPNEFAGFMLGTVSVSPGDPLNFSMQLTGGCTENAAITTGCGIKVDFLQPLGELAGVPRVGIIAGTTFRISYSLTAPLTLSPLWPYSGVPVQNTASLTAVNANPLTSSAQVTVDVPTIVDTLVTKAWNPSPQQYGPGSASTITLGISNKSNVDASTLILQDPAVASNGAASLPASNPFRRVDFQGLCAVNPVTFPAGANRVQVDVYYENPINSWNWVLGTAAATAALPATVTDMARVGGLRLTYTSTSGTAIAANGAAGTLCFTVTQRSSNRTTGDPLVTGGSVNNLAAGTVVVPGRTPVTKTATGVLTVSPLSIAVSAGKQITPERIPASGEFTVALSGKNDSNATLDSLTITEPGTGSFLSGNLIFNGFNSRTWPAGATGASFVWRLSTGPLAPIPLTSGSALPTAPLLAPGEYVTGFEVTYTGAISAGTTAGWSFMVDTAADMVTVGPDTYTNTVLVSGTNAAGTKTASASDTVIVYFPEIAVTLDKTLNPDLNTPGGTAVLSLDTVTSADSQFVRPTKIVVEDVWDGLPGTSFWDAYRAQEIVFTDVPLGSTMTVEYATGNPIPGPLVWQTVPGGLNRVGLVSSLPLTGLNAVGLRFTYTNLNGFGQGTSVKPNIVFEAASTLRSNGAVPTDALGLPSTRYFNKATAKGSGMADLVPVTSNTATDTDFIDIINYGGTGPGTMLASKRWVGTNWSSNVTTINSQSATVTRTLLGWGVTVPGYSKAIISDSSVGSELTPGTTVYQAFDLTNIEAIPFTVDPLLRWDTVSEVALYNGVGWQVVAAPGGTWMNTTGFKGYPLTGPQIASTTGVRITVVENPVTRAASTDPARPAVGSGVASSATERQMRLRWVQRNTLRVPISAAEKWVNQDVPYNRPGTGILRNTFELQGVFGATTYSRTAFDDISFIDTNPNLNTRKTASKPAVTVPYFGDVPLSAYPTVDFTVEVWNTASARASYLRSADPFPCALPSSCITAASDHSPNIYGAKPYDPLTNPFERFTLTNITFSTPAAMNVDRAVSQVALWRRDAAGVLTVEQLTMIAADALGAAQLADVVGVSVVYQSTDPDATGGLIPAQNATASHLSMTLSTQLRSHLRSDITTLVTSGVTVSNTARAQSFDPVLTPTGPASTPNASTQASVQLRAAGLAVTASKTITPATIVETNPGVPVTVTLGSTSGASTLGAQTATIRDIDPGFWTAFRFTGLGTVTLPTGATRVRVDVQLNGTAAWVAGVPGPVAVLPATVTDLTEITGIQFVFDRADGNPFSATVPSANWSSSAIFTAVVRGSVMFPGTVNNELVTLATHEGYDEQSSSATDDVVLSKGTARMNVRKEAVTGNTTHIVEPGIDTPWTLEFSNTGTGYLDVASVIDEYDTHLQWDGSPPTYSTSTGGTLPVSGIVVSQPAAGQLKFTWPGAARMQPGEKFVITLKMSLLPGLTSLQRATNNFTVNTVQTLAACGIILPDNGQGTLPGLGATQCGTSNYVQPLAGALLFAQKSVKGDVDSTLVDGAVNLNDPLTACLPDAAGFFQSRCVARTTVGATDTWRLVTTNSGTVGYKSVTVVDVLPNVGDKLLATGSSRGSGFRPVLKDVAAPGTTNVPSGSTTVWEVSTDPLACVGAGPGSTWGTNPTCSTTTWTLGSTFAGNAADITAVRWTVDFAGAPGGILPPGGTAEIRFDTINTPLITSGAISVAVPVGNQIAWNQFGVVATPITGAIIRRAPVQAGVLAQPAALEVSKVVNGDAASFAPSSFSVTLVCTVPDGAGNNAPVDMGASRTLSIPSGGSSQVNGIPLGSNCAVDSEPVTGGATTSDLGSAALLDDVDNAGQITVTNTFDGGPLNIIKNRVGVAALTHGAGPFTVRVRCSWAPDGVVTSIALPSGGTLALNDANGYRTQLPVMPSGTECAVAETNAGGATSTTMDPVDGRIVIVQPGLLVPAATVTITNVFDSSLLAFTGVDGVLISMLLIVALLLFLAGILSLAVHWRSRREA